MSWRCRFVHWKQMRVLILFVVASVVITTTTAGQGAVRRHSDTVSVFFPLDIRVLPEAALHALDALRYREELKPDADFYIIGYADYVGRASYNDTLSLARAEAVKTYLLQSGFKESRLRLVAGRGEVARAESFGRAGFQPDRRVDIVRAAGGFTNNPIPVSSVTVESRPDTGRGEIPVAAKQSLQRLLVAPIDSAVVLNNLYFPPGRHYVYPGSKPMLDALAETLLANPGMRVRIEGHVCCIDPRVATDALDEDTHEFALSVNRAKAVMTHLMSRGVAASRLEAVGFGKSRPVIMPERSATDTERNRRVEIRVLSR